MSNLNKSNKKVRIDESSKLKDKNQNQNQNQKETFYDVYLPNSPYMLKSNKSCLNRLCSCFCKS